METTKIASLPGSLRSLEISLGQTAPKTVGIPEGRVIRPGETVDIPNTFNGGTAKMFIWSLGSEDKGAKNLLWCGIIPLGGSNPISIEAGITKVKVLVDDGELPQCVGVITDSGKEDDRENFEGYSDGVATNARPTWWWILLFLTLLFGVYLIKYHYIH
jgi:hypothetical protein